MMRGADISQPSLFVTRTVEDFIPKNHPLCSLRKIIDESSQALDQHFSRLCADEGRESVAPERLIHASLLQVLYTLRSEHRSNDPHQFRIDPDAELMHKGRGMEARLRYIMENRHHLVVHVGDSIRHSGGGVPAVAGLYALNCPPKKSRKRWGWVFNYSITLNAVRFSRICGLWGIATLEAVISLKNNCRIFIRQLVFTRFARGW